MSEIIQKAKNVFIQMIDDFNADPYSLKSHVMEVEKWVGYLLKKYPEANEEVVYLSVWMHDFGHYPLPYEIDHAIRGEERAKKFLEENNFSKDKTNMVLHCVRAHRCNDVQPESLEAKIIACADSASHMTDSMYFNIAKDDKNYGNKFRVYDKMERDFRDVGIFPEVKNELRYLFEAWKKLIKNYENIDFK